MARQKLQLAIRKMALSLEDVAEAIEDIIGDPDNDERSLAVNFVLQMPMFQKVVDDLWSLLPHERRTI